MTESISIGLDWRQARSITYSKNSESAILSLLPVSAARMRPLRDGV